MTLNITTFNITIKCVTQINNTKLCLLSCLLSDFYCYAECHYAECSYDEYSYAECNFAKCYYCLMSRHNQQFRYYVWPVNISADGSTNIG
jgi:hypothetical protein